MIDVYAAEGTFADKHSLAKDLAGADIAAAARRELARDQELAEDQGLTDD